MYRLGIAAAMLALASSPSSAHADEEPLEAPLKPAYGRAAIEIGAVLAAGVTWYVVDERNLFDWDRPSAEERFNGRAWRFDNNTFGVNQVWHPVTGGAMYGLARANRIGVLPSFGFATLGSTLWEFVIEFNEKVSINDMWTTPVSGVPIGEFFHKMGLHFAHPGRSGTAQALAWTLGFPAYVNRRLDGVDGAPVAGEETPPSWYSASFRYGFGTLAERREGQSRGAHVLATAARFVSLPGYRTPARFGQWFHNAEIASLDLTLDLGPRAFGIDWNTEVLLGGYHAQASHASGTAALAVSYAYRSSRAFGFDDRVGIVGFPGLAWEGRAQLGVCTTSAAARSALGFGSMSVPSFPAYRAQDPEGLTKTVLRREGYAFGWDFETHGDARLACGAMELRGAAAYERFSSIQGFDRNQEEIADDARAVEHAWRYGVSAWLSAKPLPLAFGVSLDTRFRTSRISNLERSFGGYRALANVELGF